MFTFASATRRSKAAAEPGWFSTGVLGIDRPPTSYAFEFWRAYVVKCRGLATEAGVSMRRLDRALWQYSKASQPRASSRRPAAEPATKKGESQMSEFPVETYLKVVGAAIEDHTIPYSALPGSRRVWGRDLFRIADYEQAHNRPPLTALVVHKQGGRPGEGAAIVIGQAGYKPKRGESADDLWRRAVADVYAYWKP